MASIERRERDGQTRWLVRYRTPAGQQRAKTFTRKADASRFVVSVEGDKASGRFVDPRRQTVTVADWAAKWLAGKANLALKTRETYEHMVNAHILPAWGSVPIGRVTHVDLQSWLAGIDRSPATVHKVAQVMSQILALGVRDGRLAVNPAVGLDLPAVRQPAKQYLTHHQVDALAGACGEWGLLVRFLAYTGLRFGEMAALKVGRVDFLRRRAHIVESATPVRGVMTVGTTKGGKERAVPLPRFLIDDLAVQAAGKGRDELLFTSVRGGTLRSRQFQRDTFTAAAAEVGLEGLTPHELRHTAASLAIAAGADVKVVQTMLGHEKASMTLDLYGHLFGDRLDTVADAMETARVAALSTISGAGVYPMCNERTTRG